MGVFIALVLGVLLGILLSCIGITVLNSRMENARWEAEFEAHQTPSDRLKSAVTEAEWMHIRATLKEPS